ncbi:protein TIC 56, chloroplastic [Gastrolobium bilobum]|uniref:protein TIC 56, chloroplastic n=1 Tax=Gastrolobium bilobum TaxID=150636 RepID=UPI002AB21A01|nr:protein TIC 56, chloroplastic [Gastrolobium bilobum]XP_061368246.1 protein TIC 56, chloroplastic [Gastrolobium bilobum]XP_061368247.1 protein TIC 56, chloroplastic [Gastrolobium bilobum]
MGSINFNPFGGNWFSKPPNPLPLLNLNLNNILTFSEPFSSTSPNFAAIGLPNIFRRKPKKKPVSDDEPGPYTKLAHQFFWECENRPDHRHTPEVEKILNEHPVFEKRENATEEEIKENEEMLEKLKNSPVVQFLLRAEEIADKINEMELKENEKPYHKEDWDLWKNVPNVIGLDGRPMPRKALKTKEEADDKFWDFARQFFFGLWGFRQRPYPPCKPNDAAQSIGYKNLERRYYDFIMRSGGFYYKDRLGRTRGPLELITLKTAWAGGIIDKNTFIWGEDMDEWAPIHMVYGMERAIATWEVRLAAGATAFLHKLQKGIPPWVPLKGFEEKTYKQLQEEAYENRRRDLAVLEANDGIWPGVRIPSHALFLWASGSELTTILEEDHMPNKYIPKHLRQKLAEMIPGLRPWEVLSIEQAMDQITFNGEWYREPLGSFSTGPPYMRHWNKDVMDLYKMFEDLNTELYEKMEKSLPGFDKIMTKVQHDFYTRIEKKLEKKEAEKREARKKAGLSNREWPRPFP